MSLRSPLEEARALEGLGRSGLGDGNENPGVAYLRQALEIYQRIGAGGTRRVQQSLRHQGLTPTQADISGPRRRT